jgi:hypothetical protein
MPDFADDPGGEVRRKARALQWICTFELITYGILLCFWIPKLLGNDSLWITGGVRVTGFFHGFVVLTFVAMILMLTPHVGWKWWWSILMILLGPIGAILVYERIRRDGLALAQGKP